jgi:hypothetical protein
MPPLAHLTGRSQYAPRTEQQHYRIETAGRQR